MGEVQEMKYLGMILEQNLNFKAHVGHIQSKVIPKLKMLHKLRQICGQETSLMLYKTLISPLIDYGDILYAGITQGEKSKIQKLQNSACRIILKSGSMTPTSSMHQELKLDMLDIRRCKHVCNQMYRCTTGIAPANLCNKINTVRDIHQRVTRAVTGNHLVVPGARLNISRQNFFYIGPGWWNQLDERIEHLNTYASFKRQVGKLDRNNLPADI